MATVEPVKNPGTVPSLQPGETMLAEFPADRLAYWRSHLIQAVILGTAAGLFLMMLGNPYPVAGPFGAVLAIGARAAYLASEALNETWRLTDRRLLTPTGRSILRPMIRAAQPVLGSVQIITANGDRHLIKYQVDPAATASKILSRR